MLTIFLAHDNNTSEMSAVIYTVNFLRPFTVTYFICCNKNDVIASLQCL